MHNGHTCRLALQVSRQWLGLLILLHLGASCCLLLSGAPVWIMLLAGLAVAYSFITQLRCALFRSVNATVCLWVTEDGQWCLQNRAGTVITVTLRGDSFVTQFLVILNFKHTTHRRNTSVMVLRDSVDVHTFRRLKQYLLN